jgi:hypothetical protein
MTKSNIFKILLYVNAFFAGIFFSKTFGFLSVNYLISLCIIIIIYLATVGIFTNVFEGGC